MNPPFPLFKYPTSKTNFLTRTLPNLQQRPSSSSTTDASQRRLLVVDDDPSVSRMLEQALSTWGYDVILAYNGWDGLQIIHSHMIHGILLDINMPRMDGPTLLNEIRWLGFQMPIVFMSGGLDGPALEQLATEYAQGFVTKPFSLKYFRELCITIFGEPHTTFPIKTHSLQETKEEVHTLREAPTKDNQ